MLTPADAQPAVLVAGVGNIFLRDDGWGSEVARRLMQEASADGVHVMDYGIGGIHLAYDLLDGVELLVLVDSLPRDVEPGTLTVLEVDPDSLPETRVDSHAMDPAALLANVAALGGELPRTLVVGCEPEDVSDGMGLTPRVEATIDDGVRLVHEVVAEHHPHHATSDRVAADAVTSPKEH